MTTLDGFLDDAQRAARTGQDAAAKVRAIVPLMDRLLANGQNVLAGRTLKSDPERYTRNAIRIAPDGTLSLYALVWLPGQWTPVHDHGTWGVVGVVRGVIEEHGYVSPAGTIRQNADIRLEPGGVVSLRVGSVTSFVPNPDHIHLTGTPEGGEGAVSLHLYGRALSSFHVYDVARGTRRLIDVPHQES
jgi:predicted metal-dependent enzyme (double-stranded beta helix superfamily)